MKILDRTNLSTINQLAGKETMNYYICEKEQQM
jgi:hypothetical protein